MGAHSLAELFRNVENEARNDIYDVSGQALVAIKQQFLQACKTLKSYLDSLPINSGIH